MEGEILPEDLVVLEGKTDAGDAAPPPALAAAGAGLPEVGDEGGRPEGREGDNALGANRGSWTHADHEVAYKTRPGGDVVADVQADRPQQRNNPWRGVPLGDGAATHLPPPPGFDRDPLSAARSFSGWLGDLGPTGRAAAWPSAKGDGEKKDVTDPWGPGGLGARPKTASQSPVGARAVEERRDGGDAPDSRPGAGEAPLERLAGGKLAEEETA